MPRSATSAPDRLRRQQLDRRHRRPAAQPRSSRGRWPNRTIAVTRRRSTSGSTDLRSARGAGSQPRSGARRRKYPAAPRCQPGAGVGIVVPQIRTPDGTIFRSLRREPTVGRALGTAVMGGRVAGLFPRLSETVGDDRSYLSAHDVDWATGAAMLVTRQCADATGPWDESFFLYSEETDFAERARSGRLPHPLRAGGGRDPYRWRQHDLATTQEHARPQPPPLLPSPPRPVTERCLLRSGALERAHASCVRE